MQHPVISCTFGSFMEVTLRSYKHQSALFLILLRKGNNQRVQSTAHYTIRVLQFDLYVTY